MAALWYYYKATLQKLTTLHNQHIDLDVALSQTTFMNHDTRPNLRRPLSWIKMSLLNVCGASDDRRPFNTIPHTENMASQGTEVGK